MYPPELNIKKNPSFRVEVEWYRILLSERTALTILMFLIWICVFLMWLFLWKKKKKDVHEMERLRMDEWWGNRTACECYKNKSGHNYFPGILESSSTYHQHGTPDKNIWYQILICFLKKKKKSQFTFPWVLLIHFYWKSPRTWCKTKTLFLKQHFETWTNKKYSWFPFPQSLEN